MTEQEREYAAECSSRETVTADYEYHKIGRASCRERV